MDTLLIHNYLGSLIPIIIWESDLLQKCTERNESNYISTENEYSSGGWQTGEKGCIKRKGFESGIPIWKSFEFHFWGWADHPLGLEWTLTPEDYGKGNQYLG